MRIENEVKLDFKDVLIRPKRSTLTSRKEVDLERDFKFRNAEPGVQGVYRGIPIIASNMDGVGTFEMAEALKPLGLFTCLHKHYPKHDLRNWIDSFRNYQEHAYAYSMGITEANFSKFDAVYSGIQHKNYLKYVCIDVANGYTERFVEFVKKFRGLYPELIIIAGNVVTGEMTEELILSGADIVKVGIGSGSVCTTRIVTGIGYPQLSAIIECADAAHGLGGHIISDGGCTSPGDISKAFGAGADFVMLGGMLAGHDEGGNIVEYLDDEYIPQRYVKFYGSSSDDAMNAHYTGKANYKASEGKSVEIPYKGPVKNTIEEILGGLRSACAYVGASKLKELAKRTTFVRVSETHNRIFEK